MLHFSWYAKSKSLLSSCSNSCLGAALLWARALSFLLVSIFWVSYSMNNWSQHADKLLVHVIDFDTIDVSLYSQANLCGCGYYFFAVRQCVIQVCFCLARLEASVSPLIKNALFQNGLIARLPRWWDNSGAMIVGGVLLRLAKGSAGARLEAAGPLRSSLLPFSLYQMHLTDASTKYYSSADIRLYVWDLASNMSKQTITQTDFDKREEIQMSM